MCIVERIDLYKGRATWRICAAQGDDDDEDTTPAASFIVRAKEIMTDAEQTKHDADEVSLLLKSSLVTFQELQSGVLARKSERLDITQIDLSHNINRLEQCRFSGANPTATSVSKLQAHYTWQQNVQVCSVQKV